MTDKTDVVERFTDEQFAETIQEFLDFGDNTIGTAHKGYYARTSGGFAARCLTALPAELTRLRAERDAYRAVLEGNEYCKLDELAKQPADACMRLGREAAKRTKAFIEEAQRLRAEVASKGMENAHLRVTAQKVGCPYGHRDPETGACVLGYPGCACMDDIMATAAWSPEDEEKAAVRLGARVRDLEAEVARLEAEKAEAVKDAERYRWLVENFSVSCAMGPDSPAEHTIGWEWQQAKPEEAGWSINDAIDTAMRGDREDG